MSGWVYLLAWAAVLADQIGGLAPAGPVAAAAVAAFLLLELRRQRRALLVVGGALTLAGFAGVAAAADPGAALLAGWRRGAGYAAFFLALGALRVAAEHSPAVRRAGAHLVAQPPGRRYLAVSAGAHVFGMILSYGAIDLMGTMVARVQDGARDATLRTRRLLMGAYRGFATMNCWSPLNIMTVVVSAAVPTARLAPILPVAFAAAMLLLLAGWLVDRLAHPAAAAAVPVPAGGWSMHLRIAGLVALVLVLAEAVARAAGASLAAGVTVAAPLIGLGWSWAQLAPGTRADGMARRLRAFHARLPGFRGEAALLAASGFAGTALGPVLPAAALADLAAGLPPWAVPVAVPPLLTVLSVLGLNPIATVALVGAAIPDPAALGIAPAVLAFACMLGWGVSVAMTPFSASALATARWTDADPWDVTLRWNALYTLAGLAIASAAILAAAAGWLPGFAG